MGKLILVTGGSRSGKSSYAEILAKKLSKNVMYIATAVPFDDEMKHRVRRHRESRPSNWGTLETYRNLRQVYEVKDKFDVILVDCITVMITNLLFESVTGDFEALNEQEYSNIEKLILSEFEDFLRAAKENPQTVIMVTNEIGSGLVPEYKSGRIFRDIAGRTNQFIASLSDEVYFTVCGIPMKLK